MIGFRGNIISINSLWTLFDVMVTRVLLGSVSWLYIYILSVVALDVTNIFGCLHFSMQNIEMACDLYCTSERSNVNVSQ